jgi:hypothetical protein
MNQKVNLQDETGRKDSSNHQTETSRAGSAKPNSGGGPSLQHQHKTAHMQHTPRNNPHHHHHHHNNKYDHMEFVDKKHQVCYNVFCCCKIYFLNFKSRFLEPPAKQFLSQALHKQAQRNQAANTNKATMKSAHQLPTASNRPAPLKSSAVGGPPSTAVPGLQDTAAPPLLSTNGPFSPAAVVAATPVRTEVSLAGTFVYFYLIKKKNTGNDVMEPVEF